MKRAEKLSGQTYNTDADLAQGAPADIEQSKPGVKTETEQNTEMGILDSERARCILSYLSLEELSNDEKAAMLRFSMKMGASARTQSISIIDSRSIENEIANLAGESEYWQQGLITSKLQEARKLFSSSLFEDINRADNPKDIYAIYDVFFSYAPNFTDYCGGFKDKLEMLTIAERSENNPCKGALYGEIVYGSAFSEENEFAESLKDSNPLRQIYLLQTMHNISRYCDPDSWNGNVLDKISSASHGLETDEDSAPLSRLLAKHLGDEIDENINAEYHLISPTDSDYEEIATNARRSREEYLTRFRKEQETLHTEFPFFRDSQTLVKISPNVAASTNRHGRINVIVDNRGNSASVLDWSSENSLNIDEESAFLLGVAHNPDMKSLISEKLKINLTDIPLDAQLQLLKFMTEANEKRFDNLCDTLGRLDEDLRIKLANNFLAADFGADFGDALLDIASSERLSNDEKERVLDTISSCRESVGRITDLYTGFDDGKFAEEYARASNERLTDAVTVFQRIAKNGVAEADLDWAGKPRFDYNKAIEALEYEAKSLEIISGTLGDVKSGVKGAFAEVVLTRDESLQRLNRTFYNFYSPQHGYVLLYTRPEGSHSFDPMLEYGKVRSRYSDESSNAGVEASISLIANPENPFSLPNPFRPNRHGLKNLSYYDHSTMDKVSAIRLDREGRAPGMPANGPNRDPINPVGQISVDLAAIGDRSDTPSGKIARLVSVGNKIRQGELGEDFSLNHNTRWFNQEKYGTADGFRELVEYVDSLAYDWCETCPPKKNEGFKGATRQAKRKRGRKALGGAA